MKMKNFIIKKEPYITITQFLKVEGYISSGGEARLFFAQYKPTLNGEEVFEKKKKMKPGDILNILNEVYTFSYD
jgi:ribosome-associated protein